MKCSLVLACALSAEVGFDSLAWGQSSDRPRGLLKLVRQSAGNTRTVKVGNQNVNVSLSLLHRSFESDAFAVEVIDSSGALSGTVTLTPRARQTLPELQVLSTDISRSFSKQKERWRPDASDATLESGSIFVPFVTDLSVEAGGAFTRPVISRSGNQDLTASRAFNLVGGPAQWTPGTKVSAVVTLTDGRKSYRATFSNLKVDAFVPPPPPPPPPPTREVDPDRELIITDLSVVDSDLAQNSGPWSFGTRFRSLFADEAAAQQGIKQWLTSWESDQTVNSFTLPARPDVRQVLIEQWKMRDGQQGVPDELWQVNWDNAPFRLSAIVNRIDLNDIAPVDEGYGVKVANAGEGRFVYGAVDLDDEPISFTTVFEYMLPADSFFGVSNWALQWHALGDIPFGNEFNAALLTLTNNFGPLNQLRTNDRAFGPTWQLREFDLASGMLEPTTVKATPAGIFNQTPVMTAFLNSSDAGLRVPLTFQDMPFLGGVADTGFTWNAPGTDTNIRFVMAKNTCNGCHSNETGTDGDGSVLGPGAGGSHISPRRAGEKAQLSGFLRGGPNGGPFIAPDPVTGDTRFFNELGERKAILQGLADSQPIFAAPAIHLEADTAFADLRGAAIRTLQFTRQGRVH
jgi:hypothetical protein